MSWTDASAVLAGVLFWSVVVFLGACLLVIAWEARHAWDADDDHDEWESIQRNGWSA